MESRNVLLDKLYYYNNIIDLTDLNNDDKSKYMSHYIGNNLQCNDYYNLYIDFYDVSINDIDLILECIINHSNNLNNKLLILNLDNVNDKIINKLNDKNIMSINKLNNFNSIYYNIIY